MQVRLVARGSETVLGDAASDAELFLTGEFLTRRVNKINAHVQHINCILSCERMLYVHLMSRQTAVQAAQTDRCTAGALSMPLALGLPCAVLSSLHVLLQSSAEH